MRCSLSIALVTAALAAFSPPALAQTDVEQAKTLFLAGAQAYEKGDFLAAIQAFEEAERRAPRAAIVFSIAQAHRRHYYNDTTATDHLRAAVAKYREYLAQAPEGSRKSDASQALAELGPAADRLAASTEPQRPQPKQPARISINSTGTPNVLISLDGAPGQEAPLIKPVKEGPHTIILSAEGFIDETHTVSALEGSIVAQDFPLKEKPAQVTVVGDSGARVDVDGRTVGSLPLSAPIPVPSGTHLITVSRNGYDAAIRDVELTRGQSQKLSITLPVSTQRKVAIGFMFAGGAGVLAGATFTGLSIERQDAAKGIIDRSATQNITSGDLVSYQSAVSTHQTWSTASFIAYGAGAALLTTGALLFAFDSPSLSGPAVRERATPQKQDAPKKPEPTEVGFTPLLGPSVVGGTLTGRF